MIRTTHLALCAAVTAGLLAATPTIVVQTFFAPSAYTHSPIPDRPGHARAASASFTTMTGGPVRSLLVNPRPRMIRMPVASKNPSLT